MEIDQVTRDALIKARELISDERHWIKGAYNEGEKMCGIGAVRRVAQGRVLESSYVALGEAMPEQFLQHEGLSDRRKDARDLQGWVPCYNDHPATTHKDMLALFDHAAKGERMPKWHSEG